jgi:hypothetical protein
VLEKDLGKVMVEVGLELVGTGVTRLAGAGTGTGGRGCCWKLRNGSRFKASILELFAASSLLGVFPGVFGVTPAPYRGACEYERAVSDWY